MARYYLKKKDKIAKRLFRSKELFRLRSKCWHISNLNYSGKCLLYNRFLKRYYNNYSFTRIVNKCFFTFSSRSIYRKFRLSSSQLRSILLDGKWIGVRKSSW